MHNGIPMRWWTPGDFALFRCFLSVVACTLRFGPMGPIPVGVPAIYRQRQMRVGMIFTMWWRAPGNLSGNRSYPSGWDATFGLGPIALLLRVGRTGF